MNRSYFDPIPNDGAFVPLTKEETRAIYKAAGVMLVILAIGGLIIYLYLC